MLRVDLRIELVVVAKVLLTEANWVLLEVVRPVGQIDGSRQIVDFLRITLTMMVVILLAHVRLTALPTCYRLHHQAIYPIVLRRKDVLVGRVEGVKIAVFIFTLAGYLLMSVGCRNIHLRLLAHYVLLHRLTQHTTLRAHTLLGSNNLALLLEHHLLALRFLMATDLISFLRVSGAALWFKFIHDGAFTASHASLRLLALMARDAKPTLVIVNIWLRILLLARGVSVSKIQRVAVANLHANLWLDRLVYKALLLSVDRLISATSCLHSCQNCLCLSFIFFSENLIRLLKLHDIGAFRTNMLLFGGLEL